MRRSEVREWLERDLDPYRRKLDARLLEELRGRFPTWNRDGDGGPSGADGDESDPRFPLLRFLRDEIRERRERFEFLRDRQAEFDRRFARAVTREEREEHVLDFARDLGATRRQLRGDRAAFARWFGADAVTERRARRQAAAERGIAFCLERLGGLAAAVLRDAPDVAATWRRIGLESAALPGFAHPGDPRVVTAAFGCVSAALQAVPGPEAERLLDAATLAAVYRAALDPAAPVWAQCRAIELLGHVSVESFRRVLEARLGRPQPGDEIFVRRRAVTLLGEHLPRHPDLVAFLPRAADDPSPFVRQAAAHAALSVPDAGLSTLRHLARRDPVKEVRGAALREGLALAEGGERAGDLLDLLIESLRDERDPFVLRVAIHVAAEGASILTAADSPAAAIWREAMGGELARLHREAANLSVRRWAAQAGERVWCEGDRAARTLREALRPRLRKIRPGRRGRVPRSLLRGLDRETVGRVLSVLAQDDFGYDLEWRWFGARVTRWHAFRFRSWRFLHELRNPDPAKRQAHRHVIGRVSRAEIRAPSAVLSELAETKVPGEPLYFAGEGGWRPYLPLPDDVLSSLNQIGIVRPVRFYTSEGVTELRPPRTPWGRLWAWCRLTWSFPGFARLRNWREGDPTDPAAYVRKLSRLGFRVRLLPHGADAGDVRTTDAVDAAAAKFFLAAGAAPLAVSPVLTDRLAELPGEFLTYFRSLYANSLADLVIFCAVAMLLFLGRHWWLNVTMRRSRAEMGLILGGWGTRGKSGTERLKAGLINALGYAYVCKTTGCEAMILHGEPFGRTRELFLYRSYDKATIWEQRTVVRTAAALRAEVFLWECMGLNPAYVEILQRQWMRDDVSTITNTYPDHEDVQGPAGIDIPLVMTRFIPKGSRLITSEEQMRPILADAASRLGTRFRSVGWLEAGLLAPDVLARFPYEEHPYNIALVLALADELGIEPEFALKEMADRVVPDLGVLKTSPPAPLRTRRLEFSNGMSANERHGCVNNWARLGFDRQDPEAEPDVWITTVVNNRADRIPRSRVFASVVVNDLSADRHVLIGGNLSGLRTYIREAWNESAAKLTLWPSSGSSAGPLEVFRDAAKRFRVPYTEDMLAARARVMLAGAAGPAFAEGVGDSVGDPEDLRMLFAAAGVPEELANEVLAFRQRDRTAFDEYRAFERRIRESGNRDRVGLDRSFRELLWTWFERKLVVVHDYYASGNQVIDKVCRETPPGFRNRVMGIQNIKGTGLDFVYRWEAWQACHKACMLLRSEDPVTAERGLRDLAAFQDYGIAAEEYVRETVAVVRPRAWAQRETYQAQLDLVLANLDAKMESLREELRGGERRTGWLDPFIGFVEALLDSGDAVRRRKTSERIYRDLAGERIGPDSAVLELKALTVRQKGGWLRKSLSGLGRTVTGRD